LTHVKGTAYPGLGLALRTDRSGSESDLVRSFLTELPWDVPHGSHLTVFEQPRIASGFPDIVFVLWDTERTISWPEQRLALTHADVRIAHHLATSGPAKLAQLLTIFGRWIVDSIERLSAAQMIYCEMGQWRTRTLDRIFAVRQIVAFEAKMDAPSEALAQASRNRWFASHSYIIVPKKLRDSRPIRKANQFGVGVWSLQSEEWVCHVPSVIESIPRSYASWLFNEWAWRLAKLTSATVTGVQP
jgi:hypothetical protein